jgi:hypothetical protein
MPIMKTRRQARTVEPNDTSTPPAPTPASDGGAIDERRGQAGRGDVPRHGQARRAMGE